MAMVAIVLVDIGVVVGVSVLAGALAPRWPIRWLESDAGPLILLPVETPQRYRRFGVTALARRLPELGTLFGGSSKSALPGASADDLIAYAVEVRRAEWVHWTSIASSFVLFALSPWWLALAFVLVVTGGNLPFILVLRNNRLRIRAILRRKELRP